MKKLVLPVVLILISSAFVMIDSADVISLLRERIDVFNRNYRRAKIDLFFNQPKYSPGDTALVRTLYLQASDLQPVEGRQIVHIKLVDEKGTVVLSSQVLVTNGFASNQLAIPENLTPGIYQLVAYSDWMKNFDSSLFFKEDFLITGKESMAFRADETTLRFFPEGGFLVAGVPNNLLIQFSAEYQNLKTVIRSDSAEIGSVLPDAAGLGEIRITPQYPAHYYAEIVLNGQKRKFDLPELRATGIVIEASLSSVGSIKLRVESSGITDHSKKYYLALISSKGIVYSRSLEIPTSGPMELDLPAELPAGVAQILIVDEKLTRWAQRTIRIGSKTNYRAAITPAKKIFSTREGVDVQLQISDKMGNPVQGTYSVRVINQDLFGDKANQKRESYLQLFSEVNSSVRPDVPLDDEAINRFLISQQCPWLDWDRLATSSNLPSMGVQRSLVISGQLLQLETGKPVPDSTQVMFFLRKQIFGYEVFTNLKGRFECPLLFDFSGNDEVFFSAVHKGKDINNLILRLDKRDSIQEFKATPWRNTGKEDVYGIYNFRKNLIDKSFNYFSQHTGKKDSVDDPNAAIEDELQGADLILKTSDYIVFPTMPDLIREVLRSVDYRRIGGRDVIRIYTTGKRPTNSAGPLYVIDGVLTKSASAFLNLKPADVLTIKVVKNSNKLAKFGSMGANGVILVRTRNSTRKPPARQENTFELTGMSPGYNDKTDSRNNGQTNPSIPDLRPCLYWNPRSVLDTNGTSTIHFGTSDDVGNFLIEIEGLTADGNPFSATETFQVKYHQP